MNSESDDVILTFEDDVLKSPTAVEDVFDDSQNSTITNTTSSAKIVGML
jgi:hypothetical protein